MASQTTSDWAREALRLAAAPAGNQPWAAALAEAVRTADAGDLGTFAVARAVLARASADHRASLDQQQAARRIQHERDRLARDGAERQRVQNERAKAVARRRSADLRVIGVAALLCATVLAPWLLGRFILRDTFLLPTGTGAPSSGRTHLRQTLGDYFLADYTVGVAVLAFVTACWLLLRPWDGRGLAIVVGFSLLPASWFVQTVALSSWNAQEQKVEASKVFPFPNSSSSGTYITCGKSTNTLSKGGHKYYSWSAESKGAETCDLIYAYQDWSVLATAKLGEVRDSSGAAVDFGSPSMWGNDGLGTICDTGRAEGLIWYVKQGDSGAARIYYFSLQGSTKVKNLSPSKFNKAFAKC